MRTPRIEEKLHEVLHTITLNDPRERYDCRVIVQLSLDDMDVLPPQRFLGKHDQESGFVKRWIATDVGEFPLRFVLDEKSAIVIEFEP